MTKFILHGGGEMQPNAEHDAFFKEMLKGLSENAKILFVYFAIPDESIESRHSTYVDYLRRNGEGKEFDVKIASYKNFINEIRWADVVYFRGGDAFRLLGVVGQYPDFEKELLKKMVVAGSSAGVYFLSKYAFSRSREIIYKGLGILPIKTNCHYSEEKEKGVMSAIGGYSGKLLLLKEGEYKIITK
jgi:peptidase E